MTHPALTPDSVAVVTGAASGIGLAIVEALLEAGADHAAAGNDDRCVAKAL